MAYQIERKQTVEHNGKRRVNKHTIAVNGWTITLATEADASAVLSIMSRDAGQPYILAPHEVSAPTCSVVEGGASFEVETLARTIEILGQSDYYNPDGTRKTDEEIYGEEDAAFIRRGR
jgi:hypothetical protein